MAHIRVLNIDSKKNIITPGDYNNINKSYSPWFFNNARNELVKDTNNRNETTNYYQINLRDSRAEDIAQNGNSGMASDIVLNNNYTAKHSIIIEAEALLHLKISTAIHSAYLRICLANGDISSWSDFPGNNTIITGISWGGGGENTEIISRNTFEIKLSSPLIFNRVRLRAGYSYYTGYGTRCTWYSNSYLRIYKLAIK